jgi:thiol-disulfide isomerase/thioredoxin
VRKLLITLALTAQWGSAFAGRARAQDLAQNASQTAPKKTSPPVASQSAQQQQDSADSADQPMSLAEMARAARAKKQTDTKPVAKLSRVLDDDNMPRGVYAADAASASPATAGSPAVGSPALGSPFPEFRGKVILLDFWASWCGPCRRSLPSLKRLQAVYGSADFVVISISEDDDEASWSAFVSSNQMTWPQRFDSNGSIQQQYGVKALPTYVLLGRDGAVLQTFVGEAPAESIVERIGPDLKASLSARP